MNDAIDKNDVSSSICDYSYFTEGKAVLVVDEVGEKPKRGRPPKTKKLSNGDVIVTDESQGQLAMHQTNEPYLETYGETTNMLRTAIVQIDTFSVDVKKELDTVKNSKTLKRKYEYICELTGTASNLLNTKISAIREMNKTITDCHNLEMKRVKELKIDPNEQNDDKRLMDMYTAFIQTPVGSAPQLGPSMMDISMMNTGAGIIRSDIGMQEDIGYQGYLNNMTPEQNRMIMERNPNIKTVVVYNQESGQRWFDVIDKTTGQSVPNMPRPADFLLDDMHINIRSMSARNTQANMDYELVVVGGSPAMMEY